MTAGSVHPVDIVHHQASGRLDIGWSDGLQVSMNSSALRCACRCAACVKLRRDGLGPTSPDNTRMTDLHPVGEFGLQLCFDDGHDRGIYPWPYLRELSSTLQPEARP
ncbi:DUF971 domain-containing protein [Hydrogenophaga taeniospiralis]|uniref:DUF971 domain-containing protein n=1 Tax=Hydrogenophaga taeniospiralis TaxID=65656 RepID=UPI001CFAB0CA|nr:DUF971 domain-containing protein [Hydrogenophaga taeniospiralis]UCU92167.1 DUF971 domain-containing protein [Hydrogenophaga taeniospiralis]